MAQYLQPRTAPANGALSAMHYSQNAAQPYQHVTADQACQQPYGHNTPLLQRDQVDAKSQSVTTPETVVASHYCSPFTTTFFVKDKLLSWSGSDASILNEHGNVAFTIDGKALSPRGNRTLRDSTGIAVCAMQAKVHHHHTVQHLASAHPNACMLTASYLTDCYHFREYTVKTSNLPVVPHMSADGQPTQEVAHLQGRRHQ